MIIVQLLQNRYINIDKKKSYEIDYFVVRVVGVVVPIIFERVCCDVLKQ
jgi:hypothetical protein